jgi:DNA-binding transcriptional LysR family regulator
VDPGPPLRDVACFVLVARYLSFSRAAAELGLSQPAASQAIARLERVVGVRLFDRSSRTVHLSAAGTALLPHADALLSAAAAFGAEAARLAVPPSIRLAYAPLVGGFAARVVRRLGARVRPVEVDLWPAGWAAATAGLASGEVHAAILSAPFPAGFTTTARFHVTVGQLAVPAGDPLATLTRIRLESLSHHRILLPRNRPPGTMWARLAERLRGPHRYREIADDIDDFAAALDLVSAGAGLLPAPHLLVGTIRRHDVRFVPFDAAGLRLLYGLSWSPRHTSPELMALVQAVHEALRTR